MKLSDAAQVNAPPHQETNSPRPEFASLADATMRGLPLEGLVVLDLTLARAGPTCVRHLSDWGASVIRIQPPDDGNEEVIGRRDGSDYQNLHRDKRVVCLDLKQPEGHAAFLKLVARADVLVENMRVQVKHRLRIAWEDLRHVNPRLVYGSISGFGQTGPYAERPGIDQIAQGMSGLMSITGAPGAGPTRTGIAIADTSSGNLLALAIMMALYERQRTGSGRWVHTSLLESQVFMLDYQAARYLMDGDVPVQTGNDHPTAVPIGVFSSSDGHVSVGASSSRQWKSLCEVLGRPDWLAAPEWRTQKLRAAARDAVHVAIDQETRRQPTQHWVERLNAAGVPAGPIYTIDQVFADPQVQHLEIATPLQHPSFGATHVLASPLSFDGTVRKVRRPAAVTGIDTEAVLGAVGYTHEELTELRVRKVI